MEFIDLKSQYNVLKEKIDDNITNVLNSGQYIMGDYVKLLEKKLAEYVGVKHCITCANGTDALQLALIAWNIKPGDVVFVPSFTFYSSAEVVSSLGATPIFVDVDSRTFNIDCDKLEKAICDMNQNSNLTPRVIMAVDLFGQPADYTKIKEIANKHNLLILEDGAQGFGGSINERKSCSFGDISTTSFFPAKPLGCYGDGGAIFTNNDDYYELLSSLRVHGKGNSKYDNVRVGMNSRLDTIQAGILLPKLQAFSDYELEDRNKCANLYTKLLEKKVITPFVPENMTSSWAQYTILFRDEKERNFVQQNLKKNGIPTVIYYQTSMHEQSVYKDYNYNLNDLIECERISRCCLSLPMHPYLEKETIVLISEAIIDSLLEYRKND